MDDVWNDEDNVTNESLLQREWEVKRERLYHLGYQDGVDKGAHVHVQQGFNTGFLNAVDVGSRLGRLEGALEIGNALHKDSEKAKASLARLRSEGRQIAWALCNLNLQLDEDEDRKEVLGEKGVNVQPWTQAQEVASQLGYSTRDVP